MVILIAISDRVIDCFCLLFSKNRSQQKKMTIRSVLYLSEFNYAVTSVLHFLTGFNVEHMSKFIISLTGLNI